MFCARYILLHMQNHILLQNIYVLHMQNYMFCLTYEKLHILNKKATRIFYKEARTTKIIRDTVLSFANDYMYSLLL